MEIDRNGLLLTERVDIDFLKFPMKMLLTG